jgi:hypothetical protein
MKSIMVRILLLTLCVLAFFTMEAFAQKPLKGSWTFGFTSQQGTDMVPFKFKVADSNGIGKGTLSLSGVNFPFTYHEETDGSYSLTFEVNDPVFGDVTAIIRGKLTDDNDLVGDGIIVTKMADPTACTGFATIFAPGIVAGKRSK